MMRSAVRLATVGCAGLVLLFGTPARAQVWGHDPILAGQTEDFVVPTGADVSFSLDFVLIGYGGALMQAFAGIGDLPGRNCLYHGIPGPSGRSGRAQTTLRTPTTPGEHSLWWGFGAEFSCADAIANRLTEPWFVLPLGTVRVGDARIVENLDVDRQGHRGRAAPGQTIVVSVDYAVTLPDRTVAYPAWLEPIVPSTQIVIGLGDRPLACAYDGAPSDRWARGEFAIDVTAPLALGRYPVTWSWDDREKCADALTERYRGAEDPDRAPQVLGYVDVVDPSWACLPGATQACTCTGDRPGAQACAGDGSAWSSCDCAPAICEPASTQACACPDGQSGAQSCASDGARWETCTCGTLEIAGEGGCRSVRGDGGGLLGLALLAIAACRCRRCGS